MATTVNLGGVRLTWNGQEFEASYKRFLGKAMDEARRDLEKRVKRNISLSNENDANPSWPDEYPHSGNEHTLLDSIFSSMRGEKKFEVGFDCLHGFYMEFGVQGGKTIVPVNATFLSWIDPKTGRRQFRRSVPQGDIEPRPFLKRTMLNFKKQIMEIFQKARW